MMICHDSRDTFYRMPLGAGACGQFVRLRLRADNARRATLRLWWDDEAILHEMVRLDAENFECKIQLPEHTGLLWYFFIVECRDGRTLYCGNAEDNLGGEGHIYAAEPPSFQITVYDGDYQTPEWMRDSVMMQIMVDRYATSGKLDAKKLAPGAYYHKDWYEDPALEIAENGDNWAGDFFGGNLKGLTEKLEYIREQGVTALYLNPIFESPSNHKYNTADYKKIDPSFGTTADFKRLCQRAEELGMHIVLDGVFSHTGADSVYFNKYGRYGEGGAYNDPESPYASWYMFRNYPDDYVSWWGFDTLPNVNEDDPAYRKFIISGRDSVCARWLRAGASGWRLDVADELPMDFIREFRAKQKKVDPEAALIGEVWEDPSNKVAYGELRSYCLGDTLDCTMNYPLRDAVLDFLRCRIDAEHFVRRIESMEENQPKPFFYSQMNLTGSHDKARALSILADVGNMEPDRRYRYPFKLDEVAYQRGRRRLIAAWQLICALPGMPCVYYGDEAGMEGMADPYCRYPYPWGKEDMEIVEAFRETANKRLDSQILRTGCMKLTAVGQDVVLIKRLIRGGMDAFGKPAENGSIALAVNRADTPRSVEYNKRSYEIPVQSAIWLE